MPGGDGRGVRIMVMAVRGLAVEYDSRRVLDDVNVEIAEGQRWAVIGRNGAGKSTLVRCMARLIRPQRGVVELDGRNIWTFRARELARLVAYVPQAEGRSIPYRVLDYVLMGRFAYQGPFAAPSADDRKAAWEALEVTDTRELAERTMDTLSGGELQRVLIAGAVAQGGRFLLLDEPSSHLDPPHQLSIRRALERIRDLTNAAIVTVTHEVNEALQDNTHLLALSEGRILYCGSCEEARDRGPELLRSIYGISFAVARTADGDVEALVPRSEV